MKVTNNPILWICVAVTLFQFTTSESRDAILSLQYKVERLIEHVLQIVHDFYGKLKAEHKCIPEDLPDKIMKTLKNSIDCIDESEKNHQSALMARRMHHKNFLKCFTEAKREVHDIMSEIDVDKNYCPENMTEKTYQINVTTSYTKRFKINIKNGLEVSKVIESTNPEHELCLEDDHGDDENIEDYEGHPLEDMEGEERRERETEEEEEEREEEEEEEDGDEGDINETGRDRILGLSSFADDGKQEEEERQEREEFVKNDKVDVYFGKSSKRKHDGGLKAGSRDSGLASSETRRLSALSLEVPLAQIETVS